MTRVLILGAGISGLTLGWKLAPAADVTILESSCAAGGLAGTVREKGYCLDFGPHSFFSEDQEIRQTVLGLFNGTLEARPRRVKFHYRGRSLDYPLRASSVLFQMGIPSMTAALWDYLKIKFYAPPAPKPHQEDVSVEEWALSNFGLHIYNSFFKPYTEQFWQIPCRELSVRSIPTHTRLSFSNTLRFLLKKPAAPGPASQIERENLPTYYPQTGYGEISDKMTQEFLRSGGKLLLESKVSSIQRLPSGGFKVFFIRNGETLEMETENVISTLPVTLLASMIHPPMEEGFLEASRQIDFRPLLMLGMGVKKQNVLDADYIYTLDRPYNRIVEMNKFSPRTSPPGKNLIAVEIPCLRNSALWQETKEALFERCLPALEKDGILEREDVEDLFLVKAPYAYPIYRKGYASHLKQVFDGLKKIPGFFTLGRSGEFRYMDADQCMRRAIDLSKTLLKQLKNKNQAIFS